jgi:hypothetical protein
MGKKKNKDKESKQSMTSTNTITPNNVREVLHIDVSYRNLIIENDELQKRLQDLTRDNNSLKAVNNELRMLLEKKEKRIEDLEKENELLKKRIQELENEVKILKDENKEFKNKFKYMELQKKFADNTKSIFNGMYDILCSPDTIIYKKTNDNDLYHLRDHLYEYHNKTYITNKWSKVKKDVDNWKNIFDDVLKILEVEFQIYDINVFFEIIKLREERNIFSHSNDKITYEEMEYISPKYAKQIWTILND